MTPLRRVMRIVPVPWVFVLAYLCGVGMEFVVPPHLAVTAWPPYDILGGALLLAGVALAGWGWWTFHRARTTTVPGRVSSQLVTWGPYRFTRNPMYVGLSVAYVGEAGILRQVWPLVFLTLVIAYLNWVVIPVEEEKLREVFGDAFDRYRQRVGRGCSATPPGNPRRP